MYVIQGDALAHTAALEASLALLPSDERRRAERITHPARRAEHVMAHALLRRALSSRAPIPPEDWTFERSHHGKPYVSGPSGAPRLSCSLTHTSGLVACVVADHGAIGIDAQHMEPRIDPVALAERFFSPSEAAAIRASAPTSRHRAFYERWVLKEAYTKARGLGLALPLDGFSVFPDERPLRVAFHTIDDTPERWHLALTSQGRDHLLAIVGESE